jgi:predicted metal-dependent hydrolase
MTYQILHNGHTIAYEVVYAKRKTLEIRIHPDLRVVVKAPTRTPHAFIEGMVQKRADWILSKQHQIAQVPPPPTIHYRSGESYLFLGREYELVVIATTRRASVYIDDNRLMVHVADPSDSARVKKVLEGWIRKQAQTVFAERIAIALTRFDTHPLPPFDWKIKIFKARWGSCSSTRVVTLNLHLMRLDMALIDYVVVHELCHLHEMNHGRGFYALMDAVMPDWKHRRKVLKGYHL